ncbi:MULTISPECIES: TIGR03086 family metal-binding protein [unclassified Streptomyces]|uniref:TIGR03086 family metal-binding protein n=1 Tax=unclassified Streptomyces TaxID=2593676 RepID=UPI002DD9BF36|nr:MULTISPECIES: TIGR03086 family metal-binding protein [unclassified Streptomyces]WSA95402.1 TIGR03086 family metal-binding protein [Streptomyces sp. NBC_01795]WSB79819.1 TIGR03086 family metal-binding protein [Streptomyces sp. NBC_01775]WSS11974.1 TIGR03086 family metal-binding protein [Streptomyces sp. NBC_01186]WSS40688.1 TIGR03086 family metal-binding protein [Streptomyces sp. NBC_01187]
MHDSDSTLLSHLTTAHAECAAHLDAVRADWWTRPTPCAEWDVRKLAGHLVTGKLLYIALLRGGSADGFMAELDRDPLGEDPAAEHGRACARLSAEFHAPGALDRGIDYPFGPVDGRQLLGLMIAETLVHTWDLARATSASEQLDPGLVDWVAGNVGWIYRGLSEGPLVPGKTDAYFADPATEPSPPGGDTPQGRLLRLMGRRP